jgi:hypothetical protein
MMGKGNGKLEIDKALCGSRMGAVSPKTAKRADFSASPVPDGYPAKRIVGTSRILTRLLLRSYS